jgi:hypothetical protein
VINADLGRHIIHKNVCSHRALGLKGREATLGRTTATSSVDQSQLVVEISYFDLTYPTRKRGSSWGRWYLP